MPTIKTNNPVMYSYVEFMKICHIHLLHANKTLVKKKQKNYENDTVQFFKPFVHF